MAYKGPSRESRRPEATIKRTELAAGGKEGGGMGQKIRWREKMLEVASGGEGAALLGNEKQMKTGKQRSTEH